MSALPPIAPENQLAAAVTRVHRMRVARSVLGHRGRARCRRVPGTARRRCVASPLGSRSWSGGVGDRNRRSRLASGCRTASLRPHHHLARCPGGTARQHACRGGSGGCPGSFAPGRDSPAGCGRASPAGRSALVGGGRPFAVPREDRLGRAGCSARRFGDPLRVCGKAQPIRPDARGRHAHLPRHDRGGMADPDGQR